LLTGEHGEWSKYSNYEISLKIPLIIYNPKSPQKKFKQIDGIGELIDLFPTIVDLAGLPQIPNCKKFSNFDSEIETCSEGKSLYEKMDEKVLNEAEDSFAFSQYPRPGTFPTHQPDSDQPKLNEIKIMGYSIRNKRFRYTAWIKFNSRKFKRSKKFILSIDGDFPKLL
jgi:iduronate 2-sulfatase